MEVKRKMSTDDLEQDARTSLLNYYSSECVQHGAYLIAISVGLFVVLPFLKIPPEPQTLRIMMVLVESIVLSFSFILVLHTTGRLLFWGYLTYAILFVNPLKDVKAPVIYQLHLAATNYVRAVNPYKNRVDRRRLEKIAALFYTSRVRSYTGIAVFLIVVSSLLIYFL